MRLRFEDLVLRSSRRSGDDVSESDAAFEMALHGHPEHDAPDPPDGLPACEAGRPEHGLSKPAIDQGIASISFDDGTIGQYTHARPVLRETNVPATYYLVSDALGWGSVTISPEQARELHARATRSAITRRTTRTSPI